MVEALPILVQVAEALDYLQRQQLVHRDLKPANVLLTEMDEGETAVTLTDFGLVRPLERSVALTQTANSIIGTPAYLAPEQIDPELAKISPQTDIYALGVMVYELLTGQPPFTGAVAAVLRGHLDKEMPEPQGVDERIVDILGQALAKEPAMRFESAGEMMAALQGVAEAEETAVAFPTFWVRDGLGLQLSANVRS